MTTIRTQEADGTWLLATSRRVERYDGVGRMYWRDANTIRQQVGIRAAALGNLEGRLTPTESHEWCLWAAMYYGLSAPTSSESAVQRVTHVATLALLDSFGVPAWWYEFREAYVLLLARRQESRRIEHVDK